MCAGRRDLLLEKRAFAIAVLAIDAKDSPFQSASDATDMNALLGRADQL
jgi:hypothetical protein